MKYIFFLLLFSGCYAGLNYNHGQSHNDSLQNRKKIVRKQDAHMNKAMKKHKNKHSRGMKTKNKKHKKSKNYIN